jgi:Domain of unknown function (DUF4932)
MKNCFKILLISFILVISCKSKDENTNLLLQPVIDERVELLSILARLAEYEEYNSNEFENYVKSIDSYFDSYKNSDVVNLLREMRDTTQLAYDGIMQMAVNLDIDTLNNKITPKTDITILDDRWRVDYANEFYILVNQFYQNTDFHSFFIKNKPIHNQVIEQAELITRKVDIAWYEKFFGYKQPIKFNLIIGLGNGYGNYGPKIMESNGEETLYAIIGFADMNDKGIPVFYEEEQIPTIIHEFCHSFINPLMEENFNTMSFAGNELFEFTQKEMNRLAYGDSKTLLNESLVRACVIKYMQEHQYNDSEISIAKISNKKIGFYWISELVKIFDHYQLNREKYITMQDFIPSLKEFFITASNNKEELKSNFQLNKANVISSSPKLNEQNVSPEIDKISFTFDSELIKGYYGIGPTRNQKEEFPEYPNKDSLFVFSDNNRTITINSVKLKPNTEYKIRVIGKMFNTQSDNVSNDYILKFRTNSNTK